MLSGTKKVLENDHSSANVSIRQHMYAYVCIRVMLLEKDHSSANAEQAGGGEEATLGVTLHTSAYVSIRQHTRRRQAAAKNSPLGSPCIREHT